MPLRLIHGPPNSGRAGLVRGALVADLGREPLLVVPTKDDAFEFERELCAGSAVVGARVVTFAGLYEEVLIADGSPPPAVLTPAQRIAAIEVAITACRGRLGPLTRSARRRGFAEALERLLGELEAVGRVPEEVAAAAAEADSGFLSAIAELHSAYIAVRDGIGSLDADQLGPRAAAALTTAPGAWRARPVYFYGFDELRPDQLGLVGALAAAADVTVALPHEPEGSLDDDSSGLIAALRALGPDEETATGPRPEFTAPSLFALERAFTSGGAPTPIDPEAGIGLLRSAGERGEAEAIATEVARLLSAGAAPEEIAIVVRDPNRRGPLIASVLAAEGIPTALAADVRAAGTAIGGALLAALAATEAGASPDPLLRYLRGPSEAHPRIVDRLEREVRRRRIATAEAALERWRELGGRDLADLETIAAASDPGELTAAVATVANRMAERLARRRPEGVTSEAIGIELRIAGAIATGLRERSAHSVLIPDRTALATAIERTTVRAWRGPADGRVRIAGPTGFLAVRVDHAIVASLQDGEFPRHERRDEPFLGEEQRRRLGLPGRPDLAAEERFLFHTCLALPRRTLTLSHRDSDEDGGAQARSPLLDEVLALLDPDAIETHGRGLADVVATVSESPSERTLARAVAAHHAAEPAVALASAAPAAVSDRVTARVTAARELERACRQPGPLTNPAVLDSIAATAAFGGTTLEEFDLCSYRWFVSHELRPRPLGPDPEPLLQGGLAHAVLEQLFRERPGGDPAPGPGTVGEWRRRAGELLARTAAARELGDSPGERAMVRRVEMLIDRFLGDEAGRNDAGFTPWLLEASFGEDESADRPPLDLDGWRLHGAIDRIDRSPDGRAVVVDYKLSSKVTPRAKLVEKGKLQLQLYTIAAEQLWGAEPAAGLYHPLRGTSDRRPRGFADAGSKADLGPYRLVGNDLVERDEFEGTIGEARARAGGIVARIRAGDVRRDPGPAPGSRGHDVCPSFCAMATICRRDRDPLDLDDAEGGEW